MHRLGFGGLLGCGCHLGRAGKRGEKGEKKKDVKSNYKIKIGVCRAFPAGFAASRAGFGEFRMVGRVKHSCILSLPGHRFRFLPHFPPLFTRGKCRKKPHHLYCTGQFRKFHMSPRLNQLQRRGLPRVLSKQVLLSRQSHFQFYPQIRWASSSSPSPAMSHLRAGRRQPKKTKFFFWCPCPNHPTLAPMLRSWECAVQYITLTTNIVLILKTAMILSK